MIGDHDADPERVGDASDKPDAIRPLAQPLAKRGAGKCAGQHADQRDADLHRGEEAARIGAERQRAPGALDVAVYHCLRGGRGGPRRPPVPTLPTGRSRK